MSHFIYILQSKDDGPYYLGRSQNPERRVEHHNTTSTGFPSRYWPWELVFKQMFSAKGGAVEVGQPIESRKSNE